MVPIGIAGGVGPLAGVDLHAKIIRYTKALRDQEHLPVIHVSLSAQIADRTTYLLHPHSTPNPAQALFRVVDCLYRAGARVIGIPCNTAHAGPIFGPLCQQVQDNFGSQVQLVHLVRAALQAAQQILENLGPGVRNGGASNRKVGLLATMGSYASGVYREIFASAGLCVLHPQGAERQERVHSAIYHPECGLKAQPENSNNSYAREILQEASRHLCACGAELIVMGCSEIPLVLRAQDTDAPLLDATSALAWELIRQAGGQVTGPEHNTEIAPP